ncbi:MULTISPECIES: TIGR02186 family protein [Thioclava]|uniref:TIGR02186 family protein n=1 Tax=Thioclava litoralis TaxID=3076557 RepID=A0ABZ1E351_9RHOB|nr:TIGR02186 family protein [Thioclava sp. FTW29]
MILRLLACLFVLLALPAQAAEKVVAGLSRESIGITASFDGSEILIFGAVKRYAPEPEGPLDVIVTLEGPQGPVTVRRKSRQMGIWINTGSVEIPSAPSYYAVATTRPERDFLAHEVDEIYRITIPQALRNYTNATERANAAPYAEALQRIRVSHGLYKDNPGDVKLLDDTLFRADFSLPANLIEGDYTVRIFLVRKYRVIDEYSAPVTVRKVGLERWLFMLSQTYPPLYGIMSLALAVFAGWAANALFRRFLS